MTYEEEFIPLIKWMGERIFPQKLKYVLEVFDDELVLKAASDRILIQAKGKIGIDIRDMRTPKGYVELSETGWKAFEILTSK